MKKIAALIIVIVLVYSGARYYSSNRFEKIELQVVGNTFEAYVADKEELRMNGLSRFSPLKENKAMLFVFPEAGYHGIWMKDMLFPIDIVWLDEGKRVVTIEKGVSPDTFPKAFYPAIPALYVVEFARGVSDKAGLKIGDIFYFE